MKAFWNRTAAFLLALIIACGLGACGGSSDETKAAQSTAESNTKRFDTEDSGDDAMEAGADEETGGALAATGRKLITTCYLSAEAEDYEEAIDWLEEKLAQAGGYVENSEIYSYNQDNRSCQLKLRIPAGQLNSFLDAMEERWNILERSMQETDVTLDYVDTESHKQALLVEQQRLIELLAKAEKLEDILSIEDRLTQVRYELQNYESALRTFDSQIEYSTVDMSLREVKELTEPDPETWGSRALQGMKDNAKWILRLFQELGIFLVSNLPSLCLVGMIAGIVLFCTRKSWKAARERRRLNKEAIAARQKEYMQAMERKNQEKQ